MSVQLSNEVITQEFLEKLPGFVYWKDAKLEYQGCNSNFAKLIGLKNPNLIKGLTDKDLTWNNNCQYIFHQDEREVIDQNISKVTEYNISVKTKTSDQMFVHVERNPLHDSTGKVIGIIVVLVDVTEHKRSSDVYLNEREKIAKAQYLADIDYQAIEKTNNNAENFEEYSLNSTHYLESIIGMMPYNVYWLDKNCRLLGCNDNVAKMFKLPRQDCVGLTYDEMNKLGRWDGHGYNFMHDDIKVMTSGTPLYNIEAPPLPGHDGKLVNYISSRVPLKNEKGDIVGVVGISIDITERKKMEQVLKEAKEKAETANKAKSEFLGVMSHELRTPLNGVLGISELLLETKLSTQQREYVLDIYQSGHILLTLINDILEFTRIEGGKLEFRPHPFDLNYLAEKLMSHMNVLAKEKGLALSLKFNSSTPRYLISDAHRIRQILTNLIGNAIKFTETGSVILEINCLSQTSKEASIEFKIIDTGIGIPEDKLEMIFDRFSQVEPSYRGKYRGSGLGLSIVKQMLKMLSTDIQVQSELGKGSTFSFMLKLPLAHEGDTIIPEMEAIDYQLPISLSPKYKLQSEKKVQKNDKQYAPKILIVEDDSISQKVECAVFKELGYDYQIAEDAEIALNLIDKNQYDVIFTDVGLPRMNGRELVSLIRREKKGYEKIPIIGMTAHVMDTEKEQCFAAGMNEVISKPINIAQLRAISKRIMASIQKEAKKAKSQD